MQKIEAFSERLEQLLAIRRISKAELARKTGISKSSLTHYTRGDWEAKQDAVYAIAAATQINEAWLMGYDVPMEREHNSSRMPPRGFEPLPKIVRIPLVGDIACGSPITAEENIEDYVDAPADKHPDFALRCRGDSMVDAGIVDGDIVYIRQQQEVRNGEIAAVLIGNEATLKYVYWDGTVLTLVPANKKMPPMTYSGDSLSEVKIEGKAVGFTHWFE